MKEINILEDVKFAPQCSNCPALNTCLSYIGTGTMNKCLWWGYLLEHMKELQAKKGLDDENV